MEQINSKKTFIQFLIIHLIVWSCIGLIRVVLPTDTLEGIWWGHFLTFGNPKHPPLASWLTYFAWAPFKINYLLYLLSQSCIIGGFIYIYRLAKEFLNEAQAVLSVILLEGCWIYCYITGYYGFNPDVVLLFTLPAIAYYFWKAVNINKYSDWIKLGLMCGISLLDKYQTLFLIFAMFVWVLFFKREVFKNKSFYLTLGLLVLIFSPHLIWLIKYDFFPFGYYGTKLEEMKLISHFIEPLKFFFMQITLIACPVVIYFLSKLKSGFTFKKEWGEKSCYLLFLTFIPLILHLLIAVYSGANVRPQWNYVFWYLTGIILFYFFPTETNKKSFGFIVKCAYTVMTIIFVTFGTMLTVEKNFRSRYPVDTVYNDLNNIWVKKYGTQLKYIGGFHELAYPVTIYAKGHPAFIMDNYGYRNFWLDENDLKKSGALIIARRAGQVAGFVKISTPYYNSDKIKPNKYKFKIKNALNMNREYTIYYAIIPPTSEE